MFVIPVNKELGNGIVHAQRDLKILTGWRVVEPSNRYRGHNSSSGHEERFKRNLFQEDDSTIRRILTGLE